MFSNNEDLPLIHIIVLTWNQYLLTAQCIRSLLDVHYPNLRIVVVDNNSQDDTVVRLTEEFGQKIEILVNEANLGYAGGNNVGIRHALQCGAEYVLVLNNDTLVSPDFLKPLLRTLQSDVYTGTVTPKIYFVHDPSRIWAAGGEIIWWKGIARSRGKGQVDSGQFDRAEPIDYATGCCMLFQCKALEEVGLLDERYFAYFEDADWCLRARKAGFQILYEPSSVIWHVAGASNVREKTSRNGIRSPFIIYLLARNNLWFIQTHISGIKKIAATLYFFVNYVATYFLAYIVLRRWRKLHSLWKGVQDGLRASVES